MRYSISAIATALFTLSFALAPAITEPFMGYRDDQLPIPQPDPAIQPAGYAFSIWGVIYSWLVISAIFGLLKRGDDPAWEAPRRLLLPALAIGTFWLWIANQSAIWGTITIALMAISAIAALLATPRGFDRWWLRSPLAILAGWLTAATHVSLAVTLSGYGILLDGTGWAFAAIASALGIGLVIQLRRADAPEYGLTLIWALIGIIVDTHARLPQIAMAAGAAAAATGLLLLWQQARGRHAARPA